MSPDLQEMTEIARDYCALIESAGLGDGNWLGDLAALLPRLHAAIKRLGVSGADNQHTLIADLDARFELFSHLRDLLGEQDGYWMEFDVSSEEQQMTGSLADDLTDIYCELKHGLRVLDGQGGPGRALEGWRRGFKMHWGQHLVDAERHLYSLDAKGRLTC
jgi:hypothetical protein